MPGLPQSDDPLPERLPGDFSNRSAPETVANPAQRSALQEPELEAALQLLVERAQYITGATGAALALPQAEEMVCRASAGSCAPAVGARLQVRSGLTGESIVRRQLLRCDNAETDPRVNLEACQALGIASIVVLPLLRRNGEVRGLFELFSDHPYAFEERDLIALERMADLTLTALDLAEQRHGSVPPPPPAKQPVAKPAEKAAQPATPAPPTSPQPAVPPPATSQPATSNVPLANFAPSETVASANGQPEVPPSKPVPSATAEAAVASFEPPLPPPVSSSEPVAVIETTPPPPAAVPEAMRRVQKCASCGFPVSEGRTLCLDCERLGREKRESERKPLEKQQAETKQLETKAEEKAELPSGELPSTTAAEEPLPQFLANATLTEESWLANHVNLLAILVLIACILVAIVVFR